MSDLIERLRSNMCTCPTPQLKNECRMVLDEKAADALEQKDKRIAELEHQIVLRDNLHRTSLEAISKRLNEVLCKATT